MRPPRAEIRVFSSDEVSEALHIVIQAEPEAWRALEEHELGLRVLDEQQYRSYVDQIWPHFRKLSFVKTLVDISGLQHQVRIEMRKRLGLTSF